MIPSQPNPTEAPLEAPTPITGPAAIQHALGKLDLDLLETSQRDLIKSKKVSKRSDAVATLNSIEGLRRNKLNPSDLMITKVPVIPPAFRPFSLVGETFVPGDANELYGEVFKMREAHRDMNDTFGPTGAHETRAALYRAVKAVYGYGDPDSAKLQGRGVSGFLKKVTGASPKFSFVQRKLLAKPQDNVARGTIAVNPELSINEIEVPYAMAWDMYAPYIQRSMVQSGISATDAVREIKDQSDQAKKFLERVVEERPVVYSRAPAWHKYNTVSGRVKLTEGKTISINPFVTTGLNADFDGDDVDNQVVTAIPHSLISDLPSYLVDRFQILDNTTDMQNKLQLPYVDPTTHEVAVIDLEDFPRSEKLLGEKQGKNSYIRFFEAVPGTKVIAFEEPTQSLVWADVAGWSEHKAPPIEIVTLSNRRQTFTDDDPRAVYGMDPATGEMGRWTPTEALEKKIAVPCGRNLRELITTLEPIAEVTAAPDITLNLDFEAGWFMGAMCGDGWWDKKDSGYCSARTDMSGLRNLHFADLQEDNAKRLKKFIESRLDPGGTLYYHRAEQKKVEGDSRYGDTIKHSFNFTGSEDIAAFLQTHLGGDRDEKTSGAGNKRVPGFLFRAPEEFRRGFLSGVVDTDGSISVNPDKRGGGGNVFSVGSTSLRLIRELQALCMALDVRASVTWSRETDRGNDCWLLVMSTWDCKRLDLFSDLATSYKRDNFTNAEVVRENTAVVFAKAVVPRSVFDVVQTDLVNPKLTKSDRERKDPDLAWKKHQQNMAVQWAKAKDEGIISRPSARKVLAHLGELLAGRAAARDAALTLLRGAVVEMTQQNVGTLREGIYATAAPFSVSKNRESVTYKLSNTVKTAACAGGVLGDRRRKNMLEMLETQPVYRGALDSELLANWKRHTLDNEHITWATVVDVQKTGIRETGYDLTVPGYETFMSADGVILSNTINLHVPATEETLKEAREILLPSKMLFSIRNQDSVVPKLKHEQVLGLFTANARASKDTFDFPDREAAIAAIKKGDVPLSSEITVRGSSEF